MLINNSEINFSEDKYKNISIAVKLIYKLIYSNKIYIRNLSYN